MITVGLLWHSLSSGNLGVVALTESNIAIIRGVAESLGKTVRFIVLGTGSDSLPALANELKEAGHDLENHRVRVYRSSFRKQVRRCDLVVDIGEGDSFADIYGFKRFLYYWLSKNIVCSLGKPLILAPQTIGPFHGWIARLLAKQVMRRCVLVFTRDKLSTAYLNSINMQYNAREAIDVAFKLPFTPRSFEGAVKTRIGINVSGLLFNGGYTGANQFGLSIDYRATVRRVIGWFAVQPAVEVHLIPHVIEPKLPIEDDLAVAKLLAEEFDSVVVAPGFTRPHEAKSYIAGLDFFVGARMHACIAAFSSGVPFVPMSYSRKFSGLFGSLGYEWLADCKGDSSLEVERRIFDGYAKRDLLAAEIRTGLAQVATKLAVYETAIQYSLSHYIP